LAREAWVWGAALGVTVALHLGLMEVEYPDPTPGADPAPSGAVRLHLTSAATQARPDATPHGPTVARARPDAAPTRAEAVPLPVAPAVATPPSAPLATPPPSDTPSPVASTVRPSNPAPPRPTPTGPPRSPLRPSVSSAPPTMARGAPQTTTDRHAGPSGPTQTLSAPSEVEQAAYVQVLEQAIAARQRYPLAARKRGEQGVVQVRFAIDAAGVAHGVVCSEASALLRSAACAAVESGPLPPPPPHFGDQSQVVLGVVFTLR